MRFTVQYIKSLDRFVLNVINYDDEKEYFLGLTSDQLLSLSGKLLNAFEKAYKYSDSSDDFSGYSFSSYADCLSKDDLDFDHDTKAF